MSWLRFPSEREPRDSSYITIEVSWDREGLEFSPGPEMAGWPSSSAQFGDSCDLALLLTQLEDEDYVVQIGSRKVLDWSAFYRLAGSPDHRESIALLGVPPIEAWRPALASRGSLTDADFSVVINGWVDASGQRPNGNVEIVGLSGHPKPANDGHLKTGQ